LAFLAGGLLIAALVGSLEFAPHALIPHPPYWRWLFSLLVLGIFSILAELGVEFILKDVEEVGGSRDTAMRWGVIGAGLLLAALFLLALIGLTWWLLEPAGRAAV